MSQEPDIPEKPEPDTESSEHAEEEVPTEEQEPVAGDTQASDLATVEVLAEEINELRSRAAERDDFLDKLQRTKADFINYQKRQERERGRVADEARRRFALRILPVVDDLELALNTPGAAKESGVLLRGVELIHSKLLAALREEGVTPFESLAKPYDPAYHEAIAQVERQGVADQTIVEVVRKGYLIEDRLLRPARVVVAKSAPSAAQGTN
ncbi:MAG TPA: nucleotide exchange factor GrpE [Planctomycetota bacterium]|nr:nucleotide exchange factor GrpE [Planctomycetota bacterium]HRR81675.1 nucleotide exchange factor GrpE [Planctomycetota bacterium]HRT94485.1 nucleotide exchange factor GrpE [Planctomycetota bacterium]